MSRDFARQLRKNMTDTERALWSQLRRRQLDGCKFRRQAPVGPYILDFVCFERKVVIELDGSQHALQAARDENRTAWLQSQGFLVLRFWNHDVLSDMDVILEVIWRTVSERAPTIHSSNG